MRGFDLSQVSDAWSKYRYVLNGLKYDTSNGCSLCVVCGGSDRSMTPLSRARSMAWRLPVCELWPSSTKITGFALLVFKLYMKCCSHRTNISRSIHPLSWASNTVPGGAPFLSASWILLRLYISIGGGKLPIALMHDTHVTLTPRSPLVTSVLHIEPVRRPQAGNVWTGPATLSLASH